MRVALVTGAGSGIGRAIARRLARGGLAVACAGRRLHRCDETAASIRREGNTAFALSMDVTDRASVGAAIDALVTAHGPIHVLVSSAGVGGPNASGRDGHERWDLVLSTNLTGAFNVTAAVLPHLPDHDGGRIVNIASVLGRFGVAGYTAYCASKHGLIGYTRALALELAPRGVTVNAVCPGWVDTEMALVGMKAGAAAMGTDLDTFRREALARVPIGRILAPEEVAELVAYLVSDAASGMTGQAVDLNGGSFMS